MKKIYFLILTLIFFLLLCSCGDQPTKANNKPVTKESQKTSATVEKKEKTSSAPKIKMTAELKRGKKMFILCKACHSVEKGEAHKTGPNLHQVFGSKAASKIGFNYSDALKSSNIVWDETHLRSWLSKPMDYIPGTSMAFIGIKDKKDQTALINYLKEITK